ncbi:hypothetical protein LTR37_006362 [Vermiconidia calcicola]|uniref:Uncharacterized protein n=1 Tax=Vermiconidia calcicola TaxID=1690605 RepID=A0ACC3NHG1_9PEZI|nr:hypothetical protein LTR37_006362 [Vermiconidia calcicola]
MTFLRLVTTASILLQTALCSPLPAESSTAEKKFKQSYDFIVVGGGTAGNTVAARLSQQLPDSSVLVIEAGPYAPTEDRINIPGFKGSTLGTKYDWNFTSIPQEALNNRVITQSRGKVLGGTSAINLLIWDRATEPEYDGWEEVGNPGWGWDTMIKAMNKAENFTNPGPPIYTENTGYGVAGPINAVVNRYIPEHQELWRPSLENIGVEWNSEWLGGDMVGAAYHSSTIDPTYWNRSYSALEYLPRAGSKLVVMTDTQVAKINLKKKDPKVVATGVTLLNGDIITANNEVIISGGTIQSPGLLELSGIGCADTLEAAGVKQLVDLPGVGENLQDHTRIQASYQLKDNYTSFDRLKVDPEYAAEQLALWRAGESGAYDYAASAYSYNNWSSILGSEEASLVNAAKQVAAEMNNVVDDKKVEWLSNPEISQAEFILSDGYTGSKGYPAQGTPLYGKGFTTIIAGLMHQLARGSVHIKSSDVSVYPTYDPNFASNEYDLRAIVAMAKYIRKIAQSAPFSQVWVSEYEPGLDVVQTDAEWEAYVRNNTNTFYHPVGTCAMLPREDGGVVDSSLMVYGTTNLRVVDASVIPVLLAAHPQTGIYGIAERAAEIISTSWKAIAR